MSCLEGTCGVGFSSPSQGVPSGPVSRTSFQLVLYPRPDLSAEG